jgi:hypothetical protein
MVEGPSVRPAACHLPIGFADREESK